MTSLPIVFTLCKKKALLGCSAYYQASAISTLDRPPIRSSFLKLLRKGPHIQFVAPHATVLMSQVPERVGDRRGLEQVLVLRVRPELPQQRHIDTAVDIHIRHMDSLRMKIARHHLLEPAHGEFRGREARRSRPRADARGCARNQNRSAAPREHTRHHLPRPQECTESVQPPGFLEHLWCGFHQPAHRPPSAVVDEDLDRSKLVVDELIGCGDLRFHGSIAPHGQRGPARRIYLGRDFFDYLSAPGEQRTFLPARER